MVITQSFLIQVNQMIDSTRKLTFANTIANSYQLTHNSHTAKHTHYASIQHASTAQLEVIALAHLHPDLVRSIRRAHKDGASIAEIVRTTGLSRTAVSNAVRGKTHRRVVADENTPSVDSHFEGLPRRALPPALQPKPPDPERSAAIVAAMMANRKGQ